MGCSCDSSVTRYLPPPITPPVSPPIVLEYAQTDILTVAALVGGIAFIAYVAMGNAGKKQRASKSQQKLRRRLGW